jgi:threonyl-tRNA synthetase
MILRQNNTQDLKAMRHSCEHVLTQAMLKLYPGLVMAMGPSTDEGFYFDFNYDKKLSVEDFLIIEEEMKKIIKADLPIIKNEISVEEAHKLFAKNPYKIEWIHEIEKRREKPIVYWTGNDFVDLCTGPHVSSTGKIGSFKLLSVAGAYWRGDEKNEMLTRIYGTAFFSKDELDRYIWQHEEAKKRDYKKIGRELGLWAFSEYVGAGLPLFTQKGALIRRLINEFVEDLQSKQGIAQVWTPQIAKAELFKISGHYDKYRENMFSVKSNYSEEEFFMKPMNCPQHTQIYASEPRSYRDLPLRYSDFAMLYRDEKPGEISGITRTRSFSQDDCHIFCREDQVHEEMNKALDMTKEIMDAFGFGYKYRLSLSDPDHPEKYLGDKKTWQKAEKLSEEIIKERKIDYFLGVGEAAFYAPKLDLIATDSLGREWQLSTLQIDFFMPERFNLTYVDKDGKLKRPVMLHRAILGSSERLMAILIENYAGALPIWLSPLQVVIIPIADRHVSYGQKLLEQILVRNIRVELDNRSESVSAKIRDAELKKIPYKVVIGDREEKGKNITVRTRGKREQENMSTYDFIAMVEESIVKKSQV